MITAHLLKQPRTALTSERVARRLTTILAADVAGYSRLTGLDEEGSRERRAGPRGNRKTATRSHPDGYPTADHGRLRGHAADPALRSIPIIAVTSHVLDGEEQTARAAGCDCYVPELAARANYWRNSSEHAPIAAIDRCTAECPLLAQSGHSATEFQCPLLGVKRTLPKRPPMSAFDPKRTWAARDCCRAN